MSIKQNTTNPLLTRKELPNFSTIKAEHVTEAVELILKEATNSANEILDNEKEDFDTFFNPLADIREKVEWVWGPISHLNGVLQTDELRKAYNDNLPKIVEWFNRISQDERLFKKIKSIKLGQQFSQLSKVQQKIISDGYRDLVLAGADLSDSDKKKMMKIDQELSECSTQFSNNVLDATQSFELFLCKEEEIKGIPDSILEAANLNAKNAKNKPESDENTQKIYKFTLDYPSYVPFMKYAENRELRKKMYDAYMTRASTGKWNNEELMKKILELRNEKAKLLDYENYGEYSLASKMAKETKEVKAFLENLYNKSIDQAKKEFEMLQAIKQEVTGDKELFPWDIPFYSQKLREKKYNYSDEDVKVYFPTTKVIDGLISVIEKLYGVKAKVEEADVWHEDVKFISFYKNKDDKSTRCGSIYFDLYARQGKRGGAWMDECVSRKKDFLSANGKMQLPVAYVTCNFSPPVGDKPSLLTHDEVETLFHEVGHALHHVLTEVDYLEVSGINGVPWDGVELPSQFFENWTWYNETLEIISGHYETGNKLPEDLINKLKESKNFLSAMAMIRQLEFADLDMGLHVDYDRTGNINDYVEKIHKKRSVYPVPEYVRFAHAFSHIFAGGYAAGYYSYKWAEVLSADCFSKFEEEGLFNQKTGEAFHREILSQGGGKDFMDCFEAFRGRGPSIEPLLRHSGIK